jgi:hypothetical protein
MEVINMPRGDGTGPIGYGPRTGRGAGYCIGPFKTGFERKPCIGYGRGNGYRRWFQDAGYPDFVGYRQGTAIIDDTVEKEQLQRQSEILEKQLKYVNRRLSALKQDD